MENIAVNSRSYLDLVKLVPGVVSTVNLQTAGPGGLGSISANGTRTNSNQLTINGISNVDTGSNGGANVTISLDSVQEFKILTGVYQAEYGRSMGAQISVATKSGTSQYHGSGYWFHRHDSLNANNWLSNRNGLPRQLFRFNDVGATFGKTGDPLHRSKSVLKDYEDSKFIDKVTTDFVDFVMHSRSATRSEAALSGLMTEISRSTSRWSNPHVIEAVAASVA